MSKKGVTITKNNVSSDALAYYDNLILERAKDFSLSQTEQEFVRNVSQEIDAVSVEVNNKQSAESINHLNNLIKILDSYPDDTLSTTNYKYDIKVIRETATKLIETIKTAQDQMDVDDPNFTPLTGVGTQMKRARSESGNFDSFNKAKHQKTT